ncbi:MAG TPA: carboxypeptidase-like regulatory domain-containing protein [Vicinamibacterales bacterium]|nr:carboxypeptidase-like regulatory domain-containing protein [Vicinamibacterales bacterium]
MHRLPFSIAIVLCLVPTCPAAGQETAPKATGVIAGSLTSADLGRPVRKAQVRLVRATPRMTRTTTSDAEGRYTFANLPPGDYTLSASKPGYIEMVLGARRPGPGVPGTMLTLAAGHKIENLSLKLARGGVISGVVTDEFGDPALGVPVRAMRFAYSNGHRVAQPVGNVVTDDLGAYRIAGLLPGEYVISAVPRDSVAAAGASAESLRLRQAQIMASGNALARAQLEETRRQAAGIETPDAFGYVPAYFGGSASPSTAGRVRLGLSEHAGGIDIQLVALRTGTVSGIVTDPAGAPATASIQLLDPLMPIANLAVWFRHSGPGGRFSFTGLVPGTYTLRAQGTRTVGEAGGGELTAAVELQVAEGGVVDGSLRLTRGVSVSGRLDLGAVTGPVNPRRVQIRLFPITGPSDWEASTRQTVPDAAGRFTLDNVAPGPYRVRVSGLPQGWMLASAVFGSIDAADVNLVVKAGEPVTGGVLELTSKASALSGMVSNADGEPAADRPVILFPASRDLWVADSRRIHVAQPGADGRYAFRGLPPGDYRIAATDPPEPGQQFDPEFLAQLVSASRDVRVAEGETRTEDLAIGRSVDRSINRSADQAIDSPYPQYPVQGGGSGVAASFRLPTMFGCTVHEYAFDTLPSEIGWVDAPGWMSPVSNDPSLSRTRCTTMSLFFQMTCRPAGTDAGFGEKDCCPFTPTIEIVTGPVPEGLGPAGLPP